MFVNFNHVLYSLSYALDCVEKELIGVATGHSKRVAYICAVMGRELGLSNEQISDLTGCAVLHDNALSEYIKSEYEPNNIEIIDTKQLGIHCVLGEKNIDSFPFLTDVKGAILYHHENADGTGPFGKKAEETPVMAQIIHFADALDAACNLSKIDNKKLESVVVYLEKNKERLFPSEYVDIFKSNFTKEKLEDFKIESVDKLLSSVIPSGIKYYDSKDIINMTNIFAKIIDYKSSFTKKHSIGVAQKAMEMGKFYGYDDDTVNKLYISGALHDIGKLAITNDVLEKPDRLTNDEYAYMKNHAYYTYKILTEIDGFDDIASWASLHHEKLNGSGYPFGKTAEDLSKNDRLMACIDIYQALSEDRPYKVGMTHSKTMEILYKMVSDNLIDGDIVKDIDMVFGNK